MATLSVCWLCLVSAATTRFFVLLENAFYFLLIEVAAITFLSFFPVYDVRVCVCVYVCLWECVIFLFSTHTGIERHTYIISGGFCFPFIASSTFCLFLRF